MRREGGRGGGGLTASDIARFESRRGEICCPFLLSRCWVENRRFGKCPNHSMEFARRSLIGAVARFRSSRGGQGSVI